MGDEPTGTTGPHDPLQRVMADLDSLDGMDLPDQVAVYERVHAELTSALAGTVEQSDQGSGGR